MKLQVSAEELEAVNKATVEALAEYRRKQNYRNPFSFLYDFDRWLEFTKRVACGEHSGDVMVDMVAMNESATFKEFRIVPMDFHFRVYGRRGHSIGYCTIHYTG